jgi:hypothetical protein
MPKNDERGELLIPENAWAFRETVRTCVENVDTVKTLSTVNDSLGANIRYNVSTEQRHDLEVRMKSSPKQLILPSS